MKRILMLTTNGSLMDGINRHILTVAPALNDIENVEVGVCIVHPRSELHDSLEKKGVKVWSLGYKNGHQPGIYYSFKEVLKTFKPDIVHVHVISLVERVLLARKYRHLAYVVTTHGIGDAMLAGDKAQENPKSGGKVKKNKKSLKSRIEKWINRRYQIRYNAHCFISAGVRERLINPQRISEFTPVCYNPIRFDVIPKMEYMLHRLIGVEHDVPIIGTACRLADIKQPMVFTKLMCRVLKSNSYAHAVVIGDGDKNISKNCKEYVNEEGFAGRFHFLGYRKDAPGLIRDMSCFIMTSRSEGMPTSVLECFASGVPVAMLRGEGGLRDIDILNTDDIPIVTIADKEDIDGLANGVIRLLDNLDLSKQQADNAFKVGRKKFDVVSVASQLNNLYDKVLEKKYSVV